MKDIFSQTRLRPWVKLRNPGAFYQMAHIAIWEFEHTGNEEFEALLDEETDLLMRFVGWTPETTSSIIAPIISHLKNDGHLKYNAADKGHLSNQKEVGIFQLRKGAGDRLYNIEFSRKDTRPEILVEIVEQITGNLKAHNLPYFTIAKIGDSYHILIGSFGVDAKNESNIRKLGERYGKGVTFDEGNL